MKTTRRMFLKTSAAVLGAGAFPLAAAGCAGRTIVTVRGPIPAGRLGSTLAHEHVLVDFAGAATAGPHRYDAADVFLVAKPHLDAARAAGCEALVECTPAYLGRDPVLLRRLSQATGLHLLTNTGLYGARDDQHLPAWALAASADTLAERWTREATDGIEDTGIRPGFIKIGVDPGPLTEVDRTLVRAAARTHRATGLTIAVHTGAADSVSEQLDVLADEGVAPEAWIWVHAQNEGDRNQHIAAARRGAWVAFDGVGPGSWERHADLVLHLRAAGLLSRVLIAQDAGWYSAGEPGGGAFRGYTFIYERFLPALREAGLSSVELRQLMVANPAAAYAVGPRLL